MKKGPNSLLDQQQANELFEGMPIDLAQRYSNALLILLL
jgi:hypothetical protein